ncbi:ESPR-type extended signal peptide-containing protein [Pelistega ratti]|uniref:ESPR-type extended signal peptide-containing protein n=1 Tax=Pelistega ratti TaxID=2652177 RepID=UPI00135CD82C|nr:ESPR-type extended signal peptide-containing protein [Pelistega ratti]
MNKIFKVIWNHATQSWVAVSELNKTRGKTKAVSLAKEEVSQSASVLLKFSLIASGLLLASGQVMAAVGTDNTAAGQCYYDTATNSVVCGDSTTTTNGNGSNKVAIGTGAQANNNNDISIGNRAGFGFNDKGSNFNGSGKFSFVGQGTFTTNTAETIATHSNLAIGINAGTNATGIRNIAIGENAATQHFGDESITIGYGANNFSGVRKNTDGTALAAGDTYRARRTIAIGKEAMTYGEESIAIGYGANTKQTAYNNRANYTNAASAVALGRGATASGDSSFAQGYFASAQGQGDIAIGIAARTLLDPSLPNGARNFRIAIGREAKIGEAALSNSLAIGSSAKVLGGNNGVALGASSQTIGNNLNVALGSFSRTWGDRPNAIGNSNTAGGFDSSAIGAASHVLMRYGTNGDTSNNGVAVGAGAVSGNSYAVALGNAVAVFGLNSGALSASSKNPNAINSLNLGDTTQVGSATNTKSPITIIGGDENFAIGNNNVIGSSSHNNMVMGNRIAVGASSATTNGTINIYRLAIRDSATGQVTAPATAYIKEGNGNNAIYYAFDRNAADYKGAQLDMTGKAVADEVPFVHIVPIFNNTKPINRAVAIGQSASVNDNDTIAMGSGAVAGNASKAANTTANAIAIGNNAKATEINAIAQGMSANASAENAIALGKSANSTGTQAISIGDTSKASGNASVALGPSTNSTGVSSTALGDGSQSTQRYATAVGAFAKSSGASSVALGHDANASKASAVAVGQNANASGTNSLALGQNANATHNNAVALGSNSVSAAANPTSEGLVRGIKYDGFAGTNPTSTVSVGSSGNERQITNVAAGRISETSTDAINGSQLYAVANNISWNITSSASTGGEVSGNTEERVYAGEQVKLDAGKNIKITQAGQNFTFATRENVSFTNVTTGNTSLDNNGLKVGDITVTNTSITVDDMDITNINDALQRTAKQAFSPLSFRGDEGSATRKLGETLHIVAGNAANTSTKNLKTTVTNIQDEGYAAVEISMSENPVFNSVQVGGDNGPKISADTNNPNSIAIGDKDGNPTSITNVAGNLDGAKANTTAPTTVGTAPDTATLANISNNAATVGDVLNAGWNLQGNGEAKDFVRAYDTVNFVNGTGTTASVENSDGITSTVTFNVKAADSSVVVDDNGVKVNMGNITAAVNTPVTDADGNVVTPAGKVTVADADKGKVATVDNVAEAINSAGWLVNTGEATDQNAFNTSSLENDRKVSAGDKVVFQSGKNMAVKADADGNIIYATKDNVTFTNVTVGETTITTDGLTINNGPSITNNGVDAGNKVITNVADGGIGPDSKDAINGSQLYQTNQNVANNTQNIINNANTIANNTKAIANNTQNITNNTNAINKLANNTITLGGDADTTTDAQTLNKEGGIQFNIKGSNGLTTNANGADVTVSITQSTITADENGNVTVGTEGNAYATAENVAKAINDAQKTTIVTAGKHTTVEGKTEGKVTTYTVNAEKTTVSSTTDKLTVTAGAKDADGVTDYAIDLSQETKDLIDNAANKDLSNITDNGKNVIKGLVAMEDGENTKVTTADKDGVKTFKVDVATTNIAMNGNTVQSTNSTGPVSATSVANAINNAAWVATASKSEGGEVLSASQQAVKAGTTVTFDAGKNIKITQDGAKFSFATRDNVTFTNVDATTVNASTVNVGNTTMTTDGLTINNGPSITNKGINAGNQKITNVANGTAPTDAVNVSQLNAAKTNVVGTQGVTVTPTPSADGGTTYTVAAKTDNATISVDATGNITANTGTITIASDLDVTDASGNIIPAGKVSVATDKGGKIATVGDVANAINSAGWVVNTGKAADQNSFDTNAITHQPAKVSTGDKVTFQAGKNMEVKREGENIVYATSDNVSFNTVSAANINVSNNIVAGNSISIANGGPSLSTQGIDAANKVISNVAPGVRDTDAVNVSQLKGAVNNINSQLNKMDKRRKAGHASALATAGLMQAYREGQSALTAGVGQYQSQSAIAIGYSRIADSGKYGIKASATANTQGEVGGTLSAGYFW